MAGKLERPMFRDQSYSKLLSSRYVVHSSSEPKVCTDIPPKFYLCVSRSWSFPAPGFAKCILLSSMNNGSYKSWPPTRQAPESWQQCCSQAEAHHFTLWDVNWLHIEFNIGYFNSHFHTRTHIFSIHQLLCSIASGLKILSSEITTTSIGCVKNCKLNRICKKSVYEENILSLGALSPAWGK